MLSSGIWASVKPGFDISSEASKSNNENGKEKHNDLLCKLNLAFFIHTSNTISTQIFTQRSFQISSTFEDIFLFTVVVATKFEATSLGGNRGHPVGWCTMQRPIGRHPNQGVRDCQGIPADSKVSGNVTPAVRFCTPLESSKNVPKRMAIHARSGWSSLEMNLNLQVHQLQLVHQPARFGSSFQNQGDLRSPSFHS